MNEMIKTREDEQSEASTASSCGCTAQVCACADVTYCNCDPKTCACDECEI